MSKNQDSLSTGNGYFTKGWETRLALFIGIVLLGLGTMYVFLKPATEANKVLMQSDILQGIGMSKEINDFRKATKGDEPLWTSRLFGGMPAYQVNTLYEGNLFRKVDKILKLEFLVPPVIGIMFLVFLGMLILLLSLKVDLFSSAVGAMAFVLGSYLYTLLEAGHNSKINTLAYVPMVLAGISIIYRGRFMLGGALMAFFTALSINANHIQTTYYGMFIVGLAVVSAIALSYSLYTRIAFLTLLVLIPVEWALHVSKGVWMATAAIAILAPMAAEVFLQSKAGAFSGGFMGFLKGKGLDTPAYKFRNAMLGSVVVLVATVAAAGPNTARLLTNQEYAPETMRGGVVLKKYQPETEGNGDGLTKEYAYQWSNGVPETFTLLNPYYMGDASSADVGKDSRTHDILQRNVGSQAADILSENWPAYYGTLPFTSGPNFVGSVIFFLFILGLIVAPDKYRWYLLTATILGIVLSWGRNFQWFSDLFFDNLPLYNKFRAVSTMMMIAQVTMPILAALGLSWFIANPKKRSTNDQLLSLGIAGGLSLAILLLLWALAPGTQDFSVANDADRIAGMLGQAGMKNPSAALVAQLQEALVKDRQSLFSAGFMQAIIFTVLAGGLLFVVEKFLKPALKGENARMVLQGVAGLALLVMVMVEMVPVNRRYVDENSFETKQEFLKRFDPTPADIAISKDPDPNYRVLNLARDPWNDAVSCYHHKMIGGYHPAKFRRYNDLISFHLVKERQGILDAMSTGGVDVVQKINNALASAPVMRMMNLKYIIYNPGQPPLPNPARLGNAWIASNISMAAARGADETDADVAIEALGKVDIARTMVVEKEYESAVKGFSPAFDSTASIRLTSFAPNAVSYEFKSGGSAEQLVVFSEVYYNQGKGWKAYLDNQPVDHFRCNYVLRGMRVPGGSHKIDFKFEPASFKLGSTIDLALSSLLLVLIAGLIFLDYRARAKQGNEDSDNSELA